MSLLQQEVADPLSLYGAVQRLQGTWEPQLDGTESAVPLHVHQRGQRDGGGQPWAGLPPLDDEGTVQ